jgi:hypothetical protein
MVEHRQFTPTLDSYELDEKRLALAEGAETHKVIQITIHGKNLIMRALEPTIRIGNVTVQYPKIHPDERTVSGYLTEIPEEGSSIVLEYGNPLRTRVEATESAATESIPEFRGPVATLKEPFTLKKLNRQ